MWTNSFLEWKLPWLVLIHAINNTDQIRPFKKQKGI